MSEADSEPLAALKAKWPHGAALWRECAADQKGGPFLVSFSRGKDSIAASLALLEAGYELVPFYCERVPGISFVEESLDYFERHLFKRHIIRALHPSTAGQLKSGTFHPPHYLPIDEALGVADFTYADVQSLVILKEKLSPRTWSATGLRAADSQMRRKSIAIRGPKAPGKRTVAAIWDWNLERVTQIITRAGIKLPADYQLYGRTFDGLMGEFVAPLKKHFPADYAKVLELFPLVEAEVFRYERAHG